ncbi:DUF4181 domain-containing protein [Neobacillus sp. PS3-34]|uniref:DUF4181 domain-containing protein n=1 Tax=Neobacillus sp. PS3-34 TaxID=3070678 RepID=UPI0027DF329D|nr:DUF4181 domain-containing protein [Neobacillus sp. PS3-34]WML46602.1 DUF4181 domain-containing protein [Neobacillus sp. PS3-34]
MTFLKLLIMIAVFVWLTWIVDRILTKKFNIQKRKERWYRPHNSVHKWGERTILLIFVCIYPILIFYDDLSINPNYGLFSFLVVLNLFRTIMEWKYDRESKEYIRTLASLILLPAMVVTIELVVRHHL